MAVRSVTRRLSRACGLPASPAPGCLHQPAARSGKRMTIDNNRLESSSCYWACRGPRIFVASGVGLVAVPLWARLLSTGSSAPQLHLALLLPPLSAPMPRWRGCLHNHNITAAPTPLLQNHEYAAFLCSFPHAWTMVLSMEPRRQRNCHGASASSSAIKTYGSPLHISGCH